MMGTLSEVALKSEYFWKEQLEDDRKHISILGK